MSVDGRVCDGNPDDANLGGHPSISTCMSLHLPGCSNNQTDVNLYRPSLYTPPADLISWGCPVVLSFWRGSLYPCYSFRRQDPS